MTISPISGAGMMAGNRNAPVTSTPNRLDSDFIAAFDASEALKGLDTDGDGTVSEAEFAFYRAQKAARGQYVPGEGPASRDTETVQEQVARQTVDVLLKRI